MKARKLVGAAFALLAAAMSLGCASEGKVFGLGFEEGWVESGVEVFWTGETGPVHGKNSIFIVDDELCVVNRDGEARFFNTDTGEMRVVRAVEDEVVASGPCSKGIVAAVTYGARLSVSDISDGARSWTRLLNGYPLGPLIFASGSVISVHPSGETLAFSLLSGDELWRIDLPETTFRFEGSFRPRLDDKHLYLGTPEGSLVAIDIIDGFIAWDSRLYTSRSPDPTANLSLVAGPSLFSGVACASALNGNTACFEADSGRPLWERELSSGGNLDAIGDAVYLVSQSGSLMALDMGDGETLFQVDRASSDRSPLIMAHAGRVVLENGFSGISVHDSVQGTLVGGLRLDGPVIDMVDLGSRGFAVLTSNGNLKRVALN